MLTAAFLAIMYWSHSPTAVVAYIFAGSVLGVLVLVVVVLLLICCTCWCKRQKHGLGELLLGCLEIYTKPNGKLTQQNIMYLCETLLWLLGTACFFFCSWTLLHPKF